MKALLLPKLPLMALTATVTEASLAYIVQKLNMENFSLIKGSNNRRNIFYSVSRLDTFQDNDYERMGMAFAKCFQPIIEDLKENGISAERGIIFCFSHRDCCEVYEYFERELGQHMFDLGKKERLVEIYVKITSDSCKKKNSQFIQGEGWLCSNSYCLSCFWNGGKLPRYSQSSTF